MRRPTLPIVLTIVLTLLVGTIFLWLRDTTPAINDTIGYVYAAARMAAGAGPTYADVHNAEIAPVFSMAAFQIQRDGSDLLYLGFPPGFGTAGQYVALTGQAAPSTVTPCSALAVAATALLGRYATGSWWRGWWAALIVAVMPDLWRFSTACSVGRAQHVRDHAGCRGPDGRQRQGVVKSSHSR
ncbi:MAG: hypothetical protein R3A10_10905 [Caldilineaceae bacterium]